MSSTLTVNGTAYNQASRKANSLLVDAWGWDVDCGYFLEFHECIAGPQPKFTGPVPVSLNDGSLRFTGDLVSVQPAWSDGQRTWGYRCLGLEYRAAQIPVTAIDGSGTSVWNLPAESEDYLASTSGKSVGDIITSELSHHFTDLSAAGITTDATTASGLAALTLVPKDPVYVSGERLWPALCGVFQRYARNNRLIILPSGLVRVIDVTTGTGHSLTQGTDPIDPPLWFRDWTHAATRVQTRGKGRIRPAYLSYLHANLTETWTVPGDETAWSWADFARPGKGYDEGVVNSVLGPTSVRVHSSDATRTAAVNFWSDWQAWVHLRKSTGTGLTYTESAPVTASTAMTAGSTMDLTLGLTLDNSGASDYDSYTLVGGIDPTPGASRNNVYRLYNIVTPGNWVEQHLVKRFPRPQPFYGVNGASTQLVTTPTALLLHSGFAFPASFRVLPNTGQILFDRPVVEQLNSSSVLATGGAPIVKPSDISVMLAYSRGALTAVYPPDSGGPAYSGTAYSAAGLSRTRTADVESWLYEGDQTTMVSLAQMIHGSISDTIIEGTVRYKGDLSAVYDATGGHTITTVEPKLPSGSVSTTVPLRGITVRYITTGGGLLKSVDLKCSSRRDPRTSESMYLHLSQFGTGGSLLSNGFNPYGISSPSVSDMAAMGPAAVTMPTSAGDGGFESGEGMGRGDGNTSGAYRPRPRRRGMARRDMQSRRFRKGLGRPAPGPMFGAEGGGGMGPEAEDLGETESGGGLGVAPMGGIGSGGIGGPPPTSMGGEGGGGMG